MQRPSPLFWPARHSQLPGWSSLRERAYWGKILSSRCPKRIAKVRDATAEGWASTKASAPDRSVDQSSFRIFAN
jgi:hypothetical protein